MAALCAIKIFKSSFLLTVNLQIECSGVVEHAERIVRENNLSNSECTSSVFLGVLASLVVDGPTLPSPVSPFEGLRTVAIQICSYHFLRRFPAALFRGGALKRLVLPFLAE